MRGVGRALARGTAAVVLLLAAVTAAHATGPSRATVEIVPIAVSAKGVVLFKTWRELNPEGAHAARPAEVGWLVVSGDGLWREVPHAVIGSEVLKDDARYWRLMDEFRADFTWKNPPKSVRALLAEFGFTARDRVAPDLGRGAVTWSPQKLCLGSECAECSARQWAPGGIVSEETKGNPVASSFYAAGVALFRCEAGGDLFATEKQPGAVFVLPPHRYWDEREGLVDIGYEVQEIDAIAIVPKAIREPAPPELP